MATTTTTQTAAIWPADTEDDAPKWRLEHSVSDKAGCAQAACKRAGVKFVNGELRMGIHTYFEKEQSYYRQWRHWCVGCATKKQIEALKTLAGDDPAKVPGYDRISTEAQEQVHLAFDEGNVIDRDFKGIRENMAKFQGSSEIRNAVTYKVEVAERGRAGCRNVTCKTQNIKIAKGELRLGIATMFDAEHMTWMYKHWRCISKFDLDEVQQRFEEECLDGIDSLPEEYLAAVIKSLDTGEVVNPQKTKVVDEDAAVEAPKTKPEGRKAKVSAQDEQSETELDEREKTAEVDDDAANEEVPPKPKRNGRKKAFVDDTTQEQDLKAKPTDIDKSKGRKKRGTGNIEEAEGPEPKKKRGRPAKKASPVEDKDIALPNNDAPAPTRPKRKTAVNPNVEQKVRAKT
ncbi:hypothetical protein P280DRAFT_413864 [Massarina eburnea CBS 473.64]|uniref:PARP-type domain-containing protein n=1 Tax=Massarina eburnea CBS 473.64 TaxID=1395130 RepID=A0A6A6RHF3_9PLEO|nr:hypothetical protein P280DRAFT_413864 [Massarina eburnea CBS 473.64]